MILQVLIAMGWDGGVNTVGARTGLRLWPTHRTVPSSKGLSSQARRVRQYAQYSLMALAHQLRRIS